MPSSKTDFGFGSRTRICKSVYRLAVRPNQNLKKVFNEN